MHPDEGLRERKKRRTRAAMSEAALRLALGGGLRAVSAESVAEAAGVSPRTFRNYFWSVEEAVVDGLTQRGTALVEAVRSRPADESLRDCLLALVPEHAVRMVGVREEAVGLFALFEESPGLVAHQLAAFQHVERDLSSAVAARLGTDQDVDPVPSLVAGTTLVAVRVAVEQWVRGHGDDLGDLARHHLGLVLRAFHPSG